MADPVVHITNGIPDSGTGNITTLGQTLVDGANATMGITTGAAVVTDTSGTLQQYLRGLVKLLANGISVAVTSAVGIAQGATTAGTTGSLLLGATKKTAPTFTDATVNTIITDPAGNMATIGGGLGVISRSNLVAAADGAQTDFAMLTVAAGTKIAITKLSVVAAAANTANVAFRVGFGTATIPASSLAGTAGIVLEGQLAAGNGHQVGNGSGIIAIGASDEDLRLTCGAPTGGNLYVTYTYYTMAA